MKKLDIDKFLEENAVTLVVNGKEYVVTDISAEDANELAKENANHKEVLARIIKCDPKELDKYGTIGILKIVSFLTENLLPRVSQ